MKIGYLTAFISPPSLAPALFSLWPANKETSDCEQQFNCPQGVSFDRQESPSTSRDRHRARGMERHSASRAQRVLATDLHSLDDRPLADIGLDRGQIDLFVSGRNRS